MGFELAKVGSFYLGGHQIDIQGETPVEVRFSASTPTFQSDPNGLHHCGQAYVQYFLPTESVSNIPIVLLHGGGMCGSIWEDTPDGRPGWLQGLLEANWPVYVMDNVERGRAGWSPEFIKHHGMPTIRSLEECWTLFRFGTRDNQASKQTFEGQRFPVRNIDAFIKALVPRWTATGDLAQEALSQLLQTIGPAIVICHSAGGEPVFNLAKDNGQLFSAIVALEPSGLPQNDSSVADVTCPVLLMTGDFLSESSLWRELEEKYTQLAASAERHGIEFEWLKLADLGLSGHSHMFMMDEGNQKILEILLAWLTEKMK